MDMFQQMIVALALCTPAYGAPQFLFDSGSIRDSNLDGTGDSINLARVIHERKLQQSQLGACWCFVKLGPAVDLVRSSRTPSFAKHQHAPRGWRSRPVEAVGDFAHE